MNKNLKMPIQCLSDSCYCFWSILLGCCGLFLDSVGSTESAEKKPYKVVEIKLMIAIMRIVLKAITLINQCSMNALPL